MAITPIPSTCSDAAGWFQISNSLQDPRTDNTIFQYPATLYRSEYHFFLLLAASVGVTRAVLNTVT